MIQADPLGAFDPDAPLNKDALRNGRTVARYLPNCNDDDITRIYLHHVHPSSGCSGGTYNHVVQFIVDRWEIIGNRNPRDNARSMLSLDYARHTYHRNQGAVGLALDAPIDSIALEFLCAGAAAYCAAYGIEPTSLSLDADPYRNEPSILTHAEAANFSGDPEQYYIYGPAPVGTGERVDFATLTNAEPTAESAFIVGEALRARIAAYKLVL